MPSSLDRIRSGRNAARSTSRPYRGRGGIVARAARRLRVSAARDRDAARDHREDRSAIVFFNDTATTEIYTLSLHDALPIFNQAIAVNVSNRIRWQNHWHVVRQ